MGIAEGWDDSPDLQVLSLEERKQPCSPKHTSTSEHNTNKYKNLEPTLGQGSGVTFSDDLPTGDHTIVIKRRRTLIILPSSRAAARDSAQSLVRGIRR